MRKIPLAGTLKGALPTEKDHREKSSARAETTPERRNCYTDPPRRGPPPQTASSAGKFHGLAKPKTTVPAAGLDTGLIFHHHHLTVLRPPRKRQMRRRA